MRIHTVHVERPNGAQVFICSCGVRTVGTAGSAPSREFAFFNMARHLRRRQLYQEQRAAIQLTAEKENAPASGS